MTLHRPRAALFWGTFLLVGAVVFVWESLHGWELVYLGLPLGSGALLAVGLVGGLLAVALLGSSLRGAPMVIGEQGLRLRVEGINQLVPWTSIDAVILEPYTGTLDRTGAPRLVLVPSADADLGVPAEYQNRVDGRSSIVLLSLDSVREPLGQVVQAFHLYGGGRFVNALPSGVPEPDQPR